MNSRSVKRRNRIDRCLWICGALFLLLNVSVRGDEAAGQPLEEQYQLQIRPITQRFCGKCHSSNEPEGEIDLEKFTTLSEVRRGRKAWQRVADVLAKGEMPPPDEKQPAIAEMRLLKDWVRHYLDFEAREHAGDPGRVVMRRLTNVEYTNTVCDLTGLDLQPAREFPVDGAAGEGFTNTGDALVMSPALLSKYLEAAKEVAGHAVLFPDGFRFSPKSTRRDWTDEIVAEIRRHYDQFADKEGKLPLEAYLSATIDLRKASAAGKPVDIERMASERGLSAKYLHSLWVLFHEAETGDGKRSGRLIVEIREHWRTIEPGDVSRLAGEIRQWQASAWKFNPVGHAFTTPWQQPISPVVGSVTLRQALQPAAGSDEVVIYLSASDAGDGSTGDVVLWRQPRLEMPGRPPLFLRDIRAISESLIAARQRILASTARYLIAAAKVAPDADPAAIAALAARDDLEPSALTAWLDYLGIVSHGPLKIEGYFQQKITNGGGRDFIRGWGDPGTPNLVANSSDQEARIPGLMKPHSVAVHPSPTLRCGIAWRSPIASRLRVEAKVVDADPGCGNGVTWSLELRRGRAGRRLCSGMLDNGLAAKIAPIENLDVQPGDLIVMLIGPRDGNHGCDLTEVDLNLVVMGDPSRRWNLAQDVSGDVLAGNPHGDRSGNKDTWHFFSEPVSGGDSAAPVVPPGSLLARWMESTRPIEKSRLAEEIQRLLITPVPPANLPAADLALYRQATSLSGPLLGRLVEATPTVSPPGSRWGVDPEEFGKRPDGQPIDRNSFCVRAPAVTEVRLPADLVAGRELVLTAELVSEGSVQPRLLTAKPGTLTRLIPGVPIIARESSQAKERIEQALAVFRQWFPAALCFRQIVPVDEVVTMVQLYRSDEPFSRLMHNDVQRGRLDRLWSELHYVSQDALRVYQNFDQMLGFASQERDTAKVESWRKPITEQAEALQRVLTAAEPVHLEMLLRWASRAYRRPLSASEDAALRSLYQTLRSDKLDHDEAFRLVMARVLVSPAFLYRVEEPGTGSISRAVSDWELASRLSYFLWSSQPDDELRQLAQADRLHESDVLVAQARRMIADRRARALATEFACQWLEIHDFAQHDEKSERHFPTFTGVRDDLYEESVRFFVDLFQRDGSVLEILDTDHTFLNQKLAEHYGVPGVKGTEWRSVAGVKQYGRGGVLGLGAVLSKQSGASRTSPILRGNWLLETLLGERLPRPPKNVPKLPDDEAATDGLTVRQLVERHRAVPQCAGCHERIDAFGFALEGFDAIGRTRQKDMGDRPIDTRVALKDGARFEGLSGLRDYLLDQRKEQFVRNFCRKLLGYALGRSVQLSDEPLIDDLIKNLRPTDYRFSAALETIVLSKPFRDHRGVVEPD